MGIRQHRKPASSEKTAPQCYRQRWRKQPLLLLLVLAAFVIGVFLKTVTRVLSWRDELSIAAQDEHNLSLLRISEAQRSLERQQSAHKSANLLVPLAALTRTSKGTGGGCPPNLVFRPNREPPTDAPTLLTAENTRKIPKLIHQTSKSRCLTTRFAKATEKWVHLDESWSYYFHDDEAVERLLLQAFPEFPHLEMVARNCLEHGTLQADLWRYLVLWVYGGVYADIDAVPAKFNTSLLATTDALFVVEQYHLLSQWFMAVSPRHPLMYYAVQISLLNLLDADDTGRIAAPMTTGPHALHTAYRMFRKDAGDLVESAAPGHQPVGAGYFSGTHNRTVIVLGSAAQENEYVSRDVLGSLKSNEYQKMGMRHFQDDKKHPSGKSCLLSIYQSYS